MKKKGHHTLGTKCLKIKKKRQSRKYSGSLRIRSGFARFGVSAREENYPELLPS